ncbi:MAG TPA: hypothetical protein VIF09_08650 [Polyangiaceae bacterium]
MVAGELCEAFVQGMGAERPRFLLVIATASLAGCSSGVIKAPPSNEPVADPNTIVLVEGEGVMLTVDDEGVAFIGLPEDSVHIQCWREGAWEPASARGAGWRRCGKSKRVWLKADPHGSALWSNASMCAGCTDPADPHQNRPVVLATKEVAVTRCASDPACVHSVESLSESGFVFGARGEVQELVGSKLVGGQASGAVAPIQVDLGYRVSDSLFLGLYVSEATFLVSSAPRFGFQTQLSNLTRVGAAVEYSLPVPLGLRWSCFPYAGLSVGGTRLAVDHPPLLPGGAALFGPEARLELGLLFAPSRALAFGPYVAASQVSFGSEQYGSQPFPESDGLTSVIFGLRVAYTAAFHLGD